MDMHQATLTGASAAPSQAAQSGLTFRQLADAYNVAHVGRDRSRRSKPEPRRALRAVVRLA